MDAYTPPSQRHLSRPRRQAYQGLWFIASMALPALTIAGILLNPVLAADDDDPPDEHVVQPGDTLNRIADQYGITAEALAEANGISDPDRIFVGQVLVIPHENESGSGLIHEVQPGDSLASIASRYGLPIEEIAVANGISSSAAIGAGQRLLIPQLNSADSLGERDYASYTLGRGDSLYRVSVLFGVPVEDIIAANSLSSPASIYPGLSIRVPLIDAGELPQPETPQRSHTVAPGETLRRIALQYGVTVDGIIAENGLRSSSLSAGQVLLIPYVSASARPADAVAATSYRVEPGDSLNSIAMEFGVTSNALRAANNLSSSTLIPGQVLTIPTAHAGASSVAYASIGPGLCEATSSVAVGSGYFLVPVRQYVLTQRYHPWHGGVDLAWDTGEPILAADSGVVVFSGWNSAGYGNLLVIDHGNGWRSYYAHLESLFVACDEAVERGQLVAAMGSTGNSSGPHLHFELLRYGVAVDPEGYLRF